MKNKTAWRVTSYLRWVKRLYRGLAEDLARDRARQEWWVQGVSVAPTAIIRMGPDAVLEIGEGSMIGPYTLLDMLQDPLATASTGSILRIGQRTSINEFNNIRAAGGEVILGNDCLISQFVSIVATNHSIARERPIRDQPWDTTKYRVQIGDDVWVGTHSVILPGVTIGSGSVIAAGSVVTSDIPEYVVAAGAPARVKRLR